MKWHLQTIKQHLITHEKVHIYEIYVYNKIT